MSGFNQHLHVPDDSSFQSPRQRRPRPASPHDPEEETEDRFLFAHLSQQISLRDIDIRNGVRRSPSPPRQQLPTAAASNNTMSAEDRIQQLTQLAEQQQKQMADANAYSNLQTV